jgi:hypothetical protein
MHMSTKYARSRQGAGMRAKALTTAMNRKEEYLGARVPKELKDKVIKRAAGLGIPVSILIRKVLEGVFSESDPDMSSLSVNNLTEIPQARHGNIAENKYPKVLGWERIRLNRRTACDGCGNNVESGVYATLGLSQQGDDHVILCDICSESL